VACLDITFSFFDGSHVQTNKVNVLGSGGD
jgi:hypothetical protein